jgi:hypothetical protein
MKEKNKSYATPFSQTFFHTTKADRKLADSIEIRL